MSGFNFTSSPPDSWDELCSANGALFGTRRWQSLLRAGFGCDSAYASNGETGIVVSVFRGGPFRIGYVGFPAGGVIGQQLDSRSIVAALQSAASDTRIVCARIPVRDAGAELATTVSCVETPETVIDNLPDWHLGQGAGSLGRAVRKARRSDLQIRHVTVPADGQQLFDLYAGTVRRHQGSMRYTRVYFEKLIDLSANDPQLQVLAAVRDEAIGGFIVVARHGDVAYYLHGGTHDEFRKDSPSDLLFDRAIHEARDAGCVSFNMMASPPDQPSLVRYKEKWGGTTRTLKTCTAPLRPTYHLFRAAERIYSIFR
ncbi:MAG: GNAT family N-acetyltransferase [Woeseia sp.]|nr:GNAT family N-acetyltransferase [Gammaproteobacteria bacterium]NNE61916.1 GNAT family N-acetyltransferase [Woeseia sp.]